MPGFRCAAREPALRRAPGAAGRVQGPSGRPGRLLPARACGTRRGGLGMLRPAGRDMAPVDGLACPQATLAPGLGVDPVQSRALLLE